MRTTIAEDEGGQVLVTVYETGRVEIAERMRSYNTWGPPRVLQLVEEQDEAHGGWKDDPAEGFQTGRRWR